MPIPNWQTPNVQNFPLFFMIAPLYLVIRLDDEPEIEWAFHVND